jgi:signal transduction histidine kinase
MKGEGLGLMSMTERILPFNGTLSILSRPKQGTELIVRIPVQL